ncbi:unnamed protein product, partial [Ectocarpus sp. 13 AM-2016]
RRQDHGGRPSGVVGGPRGVQGCRHQRREVPVARSHRGDAEARQTPRGRSLPSTGRIGETVTIILLVSCRIPYAQRLGGRFPSRDLSLAEGRVATVAAALCVDARGVFGRASGCWFGACFCGWQGKSGVLDLLGHYFDS